jgi:hypothetical protein
MNKSMICLENFQMARILPVKEYDLEEAAQRMRLLENDVALVTILTLLLFSVVKSLDVPGDGTAAPQGRASITLPE